VFRANLTFKQAATEDIDIGGLEIKESGGKKKSQSRGGRGAVKAKKKADPQKVKVGRVSRGKKKAVTHVTGLHSYEVPTHLS
jgi:translation initiation factor 1 (eIF-1/SUI1)